MIAFEVFLNGQKKTVAGADDLSLLMAEVRASGRLGDKCTIEVQPNGPINEVRLGAVGFTNAENREDAKFLKWISHDKLKVGDRVKIRIVETEKADIPSER